DGQIGHDHVDIGRAQLGDDVDRLLVGLLDDLAVVLPEPVIGGPALDRHPRRRDVGQLDRVVFAGHDRLGEVAADLLRIDIERRHELDVGHVVVTEFDVHQTRDSIAGIGIAVVLDALHKGRRAVADTDDGYADGAHRGCLLLYVFTMTAPAGPKAVFPGSRGYWVRLGSSRTARWRSALPTTEPRARRRRGRGAEAPGCMSRAARRRGTPPSGEPRPPLLDAPAAALEDA